MKAIVCGGKIKNDVFQYQISENVIPHIGSFIENGYTTEEMKMQNEGRKIMHLPELKVTCTCVRVPVYTGHTLTIHAEFAGDITPDQARALLADLRTHSLAEGGSTLTQQLAKNELFTQDKHLARKAAEMLAAFDLEKAYSKQQIFEMYANTIYFGNGCYGITQAAEGYFGKEPAQLTDAEAVFLAGLPNAPSLYASSPELALKRTQTVLKRMVKCRVLTQMQADAIAEEAAGLTV